LDVLEGLNEPQRQAVTHVEGPLLVLAGAGSGKTRVITRRLAYLVTRGAAPCSLLAITFTNKAAGEMKRRVDEFGVARGATVCTFHSLCARLLREFAEAARLPRAFSILDRDDQLRVIKDAMKRLEIPTDRIQPGAAHSAISRAKNNLLAAQQFAAQVRDPYMERIGRIYAEYEQLLAASGAMDFDDLLGRMAMLMRDRPDVRAALGQRYRFILIDEYQDTNRAQYYIAHGIATEHGNICATGDPDQSIYAWRGADIRNILDFQKDYPGAKVVRLEENYRSTAPILAAASRLICRNRHRQEKRLWTRREGGREVRVLACDDEHAEAREVARRIQACRQGGRAGADIAVFYRVNALSRVLEQTLLRSGVPYQIARGVEFYNRKEIKDVVAYLKLLVNPADSVSCLRVINTPPRGIGAATVERLQAQARAEGVGLLEACRRAPRLLPGAAGAKSAAFADLIASLAALPATAVRETVETVIKRAGLDKAAGEGDEEGQAARANIEELISAAEEFDRTEGGTLADWLVQVSLVSDADHFEGAGGAVTLMTLHAAKGLEFPVVFVVGCEEGLLPFERDASPHETPDENRIEEERRLAFVGMTRAKEELTLAYARQRMIRGRTVSQARSPFLDEIGREGVMEEDLTSLPPSRHMSAGWEGRERQSGGGKRFAGGGFYEAADERREIEAQVDRAVSRAESGADHSFPPEYEDLKVGSSVRHEKFGRGKVLALRQPWPETRAEIQFENAGKKTIVLALARLRVE
jgi:DNA helicase II / ATP-dependent DNA helicase PcrA